MTDHQHYPSPALTDIGSTQATPPSVPSVGKTGGTNGENVGEDSGERIGEGSGETPLENRPVGAPAPRSNENSADVDPNSVLASRTRNRRQAHAAILNHLEQHAGYHAAFATNTAPRSQLHRDRLLEEPKNWKQMMKHPHMNQFSQAASQEFEHLQSRGTFKLATRATVRSEILPLVWVFKYKFDNDGYLLKHKARLCVRGDLRKTEQDTAAATLAIRVFCCNINSYNSATIDCCAVAFLLQHIPSSNGHHCKLQTYCQTV